MAKFRPNNKLEKSLLQKLLVLINSDDGEEDYDTTWYPNGYDNDQVTIGNDDTGSCDAGLRFLRPCIPNNAKIVKAVLRVKAALNSTKRPTWKIKGILEPDPNTFAAGGSDRPSTRAKTSASVDWDIGEDWALNEWYESPDIKAVIQELIDQAEFSGKALALVIEDDSSPANNYNNIWDFNSGQENAARLVLTLAPNQP